MTYQILHRTLYEYAAPVTVSHHVARLEPRETSGQEREQFSLKIFPEPALRKSRPDYFDNRLCFFSIQEVHSRLEIIAHSRVSVQAHRPAAAEPSTPWNEVAGMFRDPVSPEVVEPYQFIFDSPQASASFDFADYASESFPKGTPFLTGVRDLTGRIFNDFKYDPKATTVATPLDEVWKKRRGVCQDFAHLGIACLRSLGLPARYVSGYLRTRPPEGKPRLVGADASHAWFAIFCPGVGWVDFDPTNNVQPAEEHITVAVGRDYADVSPVAGVITGGGAHSVKVSVDVTEM
jgi:transglutaminase-like putative cysteine protease